jgi:hypothetical protein
MIKYSENYLTNLVPMSGANLFNAKYCNKGGGRGVRVKNDNNVAHLEMFNYTAVITLLLHLHIDLTRCSPLSHYN